jgi:hypothetical protein
MIDMSAILKDYAITHALLRPVRHPRLGRDVWARTAARYLRFLRPVRVQRLELKRLVYGRSIPSVPAHPAHVTVSTLDRQSNRWRPIHEADLPYDPRVAGEGLSQDMPIETMEAHFKKILDDPPLAIELGGVTTDHLRVECDREHPVWPNHGECNGGPFNVPFGTLNELRAWGDVEREPASEPVYHPLLRAGRVRPKAPRGMTVQDRPDMILYQGKKLSVGFSLRRAMIVHLGWDALGAGMAGRSRALATFSRIPVGLCGPVLRTLSHDIGSHLWTGRVSVDGNRVCYTGLHAVPGLWIDAAFTVEPDRLRLELTQRCDKPLPAIEAEAWRFVWDIKAGITGVVGEPLLRPGRAGDVSFPAWWASDGVGCLSCATELRSSGMPRLQIESYRSHGCVVSGLRLGDPAGPDECLTVPAGTRRATFEFAVTNLRPSGVRPSARLHTGLRRHWATAFSCFRPEYRGFSNHSTSVNCHVNQAHAIEVVAHTARPEAGPDPIALARFTIGTALLDGGGYGYHRNLYLDSDPILVSGAGRIHQAAPDMDWLRRIEPGLAEAARRMLDTLGPEGMAICRDLSGNSGSYRWSSNAMDVVGFGHMDGYVNAWTYRALRNATALLTELGQTDLAGRCRVAAETLASVYAKWLLNPETGWVAAWRSRDGALHDHASLFVNAPALAFGLLAPGQAKRALRNLERLRENLRMKSARLGLPCNLLTIPPEDHMLPKMSGEILQTFELYTNGGINAGVATYYLRALSTYGFRARARKLAEELADGFAAGMFTGGDGQGREFLTWSGLPAGYEGTLIASASPMYSMAIELGALKPPDPEWWPSGGA